MGRRKFEALNADSAEARNMKADGPGVCDHKLVYAARIKALRAAANMSSLELATKLGLTRSAILNWESGRSRPDISNIPALCCALNVPISEFFAVAGTSSEYSREELSLISCYRGLSGQHRRFLVKMARELQQMDKAVGGRIPVIRLLKKPYAVDAVAAGVGTAAFEAACEQCYVHDTPQLERADILFRVNGDSMEPDYPDGCTVMVKLASDVKPGEIAVFAVDGTLFIKEFQTDGLHSLNPAYPTMRTDRYGDFRLIGIATGIVDEDDFADDDELAAFESRKEAAK